MVDNQHGDLPYVLVQVKKNAALCTTFTASGGGAPKKGETLSQEDVVRNGAWPTVSAILSKEYVEV